MLVVVSELLKVQWDSECLPFLEKERLEKEVSALPKIQRREKRAQVKVNGENCQYL